MNKLEIAMKMIGCVVVALIFVGLFNLPMMETLIPFILVGAAITLALYVINAFKTKNYGRMIISVPTKDDLEKTAKWLDAHNIHYSKKEAEGDVKFIKLIEKSLSEGGVK